MLGFEKKLENQENPRKWDEILKEEASIFDQLESLVFYVPKALEKW